MNRRTGEAMAVAALVVLVVADFATRLSPASPDVGAPQQTPPELLAALPPPPDPPAGFYPFGGVPPPEPEPQAPDGKQAQDEEQDAEPETHYRLYGTARNDRGQWRAVIGFQQRLPDGEVLNSGVANLTRGETIGQARINDISARRVRIESAEGTERTLEMFHVPTRSTAQDVEP